MRKGTMKKGLALLAATMVLLTGSTLASWAAVRLETVSDLWWDEENLTVATWDEVEDAFQYELYLYRDESKVAEFKTKKLTYDFQPKMTEVGDYTFRVRALAKSGSKEFSNGYWSSYSDGYYADESFVAFVKGGGKIDTVNSGPGAGNSTGTATLSPANSVVKGQWIQDATGWWYRNNDGSYPVNQWFQDAATSKWYYFNTGGYMMTGWLDVNGARYYCGGDGAMLTGIQTIDGAVYEFDASGALIRK